MRASFVSSARGRTPRAVRTKGRRAKASACLTIGVAIASYRRPDDLKRCLEALSEQSRLPDDVIVVVRADDEATQDTVAAVAGATLAGSPGPTPARGVLAAGAGNASTALAGAGGVPARTMIALAAAGSAAGVALAGANARPAVAAALAAAASSGAAGVSGLAGPSPIAGALGPAAQAAGATFAVFVGLMPAGFVEAAAAYLLADAALASAFGQAAFAWADQAPAGTPLPMLILGDLDGHAEYQSPGADGLTPWDERGTWPVRVYAAGKAQAIALGRRVEAALFDAALTFADGQLLYCRRESAATDKDPASAPGATKEVWARTLGFTVHLARLAAPPGGGPGPWGQPAAGTTYTTAGGDAVVISQPYFFQPGAGGQNVGTWTAPVRCTITSVSFSATGGCPDPANTWAPGVERFVGGAYSSTIAAGSGAILPYTPQALAPAATVLQAGDLVLCGVAPVGNPPALAGPSFTITWAPSP